MCSAAEAGKRMIINQPLETAPDSPARAAPLLVRSRASPLVIWVRTGREAVLRPACLGPGLFECYNKVRRGMEEAVRKEGKMGKQCGIGGRGRGGSETGTKASLATGTDADLWLWLVDLSSDLELGLS